MGVDISRLVALGDSAGGNLALVAALRNPNLFAATVLVALGTTNSAFWILAASLPFTLMTGALRGLFEAHEDFGTSNALRLPLVFFTYVSPLLVLPFSTSLVPIVATLAVGRALTFALHGAVALHCPAHQPRPRRCRQRPGRSSSTTASARCATRTGASRA
mgnify:CR=1 FL=1